MTDTVKSSFEIAAGRILADEMQPQKIFLGTEGIFALFGCAMVASTIVWAWSWFIKNDISHVDDYYGLIPVVPMVVLLIDHGITYGADSFTPA